MDSGQLERLPDTFGAAVSIDVGHSCLCLGPGTAEGPKAPKGQEWANAWLQIQGTLSTVSCCLPSPLYKCPVAAHTKGHKLGA